jgi:hypothetical protein
MQDRTSKRILPMDPNAAIPCQPPSEIAVIEFRTQECMKSSQPGVGELFIRQNEAAGRRELALQALKDGSQFPRDEGACTRLIVQDHPTLDDMLAASVILRKLSNKEIHSNVLHFARYAGLVREGITPTTFSPENTLEGMFSAIRACQGEDLSSPANARVFLQLWQQMENVIFDAAQSGLNPFAVEIPFPAAEFARERAYLANDQRLYEADKGNGEEMFVQLPGRKDDVPALLLKSPRSSLWKMWARIDRQSANRVGYGFIGVKSGPGQWAFSVNPVDKVSLLPLAEALQSQEILRNSLAATDPWFDGRPFAYSLVASPLKGTAISDADIRAILKRALRARSRPTRANNGGKWLHPGAIAAMACSIVVFLLAARYPGIDLHDTGAKDIVNASHMLTAPETHRGYYSSKISHSPNSDSGVITAWPSKTGEVRLKVLTVGVSDYQNFTDLPCAAADAEGLCSTFSTIGKPLFESVFVDSLINEKANRDQLVERLDQFCKTLTENDLAVLSFSGHGMNDEFSDYYFLPYEYDPNRHISLTAFSWYEIRKRISQVPCTVILILDTCHSGTVTKAGLVDRSRKRGNEDDVRAMIQRQARTQFVKSEKGLYVIAACLSGQQAEERPTWGHGALTMSVLEGLQNKYLYTGVNHSDVTTPLPTLTKRHLSSVLDLGALSHFIVNRVQELTKGAQAVTTHQSGDLDLKSIFLVLRHDG